jgi:hypothetical protein
MSRKRGIRWFWEFGFFSWRHYTSTVLLLWKSLISFSQLLGMKLDGISWTEYFYCRENGLAQAFRKLSNRPEEGRRRLK